METEGGSIVLEIVFGSSAQGSLRAAQNYGRGKRPGTAVGIGVLYRDGETPSPEELEKARKQAEERERQTWEKGAPLGGTPQDIFCFDLALSVGDITEEIPGPRRQQAMEELYSAAAPKDCRKEVEAQLRRANEGLEAAKRRASQGEAVRIWYSSQPDEVCGMHWFLSQLAQWGRGCGPVALIRLPPWVQREDGVVVRKSGWGQVRPEEWSGYQSLAQTAPSAFIQGCAARWRELQKENGPLRGMLNGQLVSLPEDVYDSFIFREIEAEPEVFREAEVIGRVLGKYQLGIGDGWIATRIEGMIRAGMLEPVTQPEQGIPYRRQLRKRPGSCRSSK